MSRFALALSLTANAALVAGLVYLLTTDPVVATLTTPTGEKREILAAAVNKEMAARHGEEVASDMVGRALVDLAAQESNIRLDSAEFEARWQDWLAEPGTRARIDIGEVTERALRDRLMTLLLLDQLSWNGLTPPERETLLRDAFENNQRDFEQLRLRHIVVESRKDADDVTQRLIAGVEFAQLAKRFSLDPLTRDQGGDLGWKGRRDLTEDLRAFVFLLPVGGASAPVSSPGGWHIFLVEDRRDTFEDCKEQVRRELLRQMRQGTLDELRERFKVERSEAAELLAKLRRPGFPEEKADPAFQQPARGERSAHSSPSPEGSPTLLPAASTAVAEPPLKAVQTPDRASFKDARPGPAASSSPSVAPSGLSERKNEPLGSSPAP